MVMSIRSPLYRVQSPPGAQPRFQSWGVQFLGLGYYYPSIEKIDMSTQFDAVGYIITLYSSKGIKKLGVRPNFGEVRTPVPSSACAHARTASANASPQNEKLQNVAAQIQSADSFARSNDWTNHRCE